jgi:hypothetical protein
VLRPVRLEHDLCDLASVGPQGSDLFGSPNSTNTKRAGTRGTDCS